MTPRQSLIAALLMVGCAVPAAAAPKPGAAASAPATAAKGRAAVIGNATAGPPRAPAAARAPSRKTRVPKSGAPARATGPAGQASATARNPAASTRTLEDIHIEGEIPVPQVLFITTRDQRRFVEFEHHRYLRTCRTIGEDTALPSRIVVSGAATLPERSHSDE